MTVVRSNKYIETPPPQTNSQEALVQGLHNELLRLASAIEAQEATTVNYGKEYRNFATGSELKISWRNGQKQSISLETASVNIIFGDPLGCCNLMLRIIQDSAGSRTFALPSNVKWAGGTEPTWSVGADMVDIVCMYFDGADYHATASLDSK